MSDPRAPRSLLSVASPLIVGKALTGILSFAIPVVLARQLAPHDYGTYKQFFLVAATCYLMGQFGLTASLYYFVPRGGAQAGRYVVQALLGLLVTGLVFAGIIFGAIGELAHRFANPDVRALAVPLAIYVVGALGAAPLELTLTSRGKTGWAALSFVVSDVVRTLVLVAPILAGRGLTALAWAAAGFATLRLVAAWTVVLSGRVVTPLWPSRETLAAQARYAIPFGGAVLLSTVQMQLPQYVVSAVTDAATFAIYAVGALQIPFTDTLYSPVAEVMMVRLARAPREEAAGIFREAVARLFVFFLPLAAFCWAVAAVLIPTLYTDVYRAAVPIFMIAAAEVLFSTLPVDGLLRSLDATRTLFVLSLVRVLVAIVAVPAGLMLFGLPGAMAGYLGTHALGKLLALREAARRLGVPVRSLVPWRELGSWIVRAAALFGAVTALRLLGPWQGWAFLFASVPVAGAVWGVSLLTAGELRRRSGAVPATAPVPVAAPPPAAAPLGPTARPAATDAATAEVSLG